MAVETRFTIEEIEYLQGLPLIESLDGEEHERNRSLAWSRPPRAAWRRAVPCAELGCDMWVHFHNGWVYGRHGEAIAKALATGNAAPEFVPWLESIHAHEAATR